MKELISLLTQSLWLMDENWLRILISSVSDVTKVKAQLIGDWEEEELEGYETINGTAVIPVKGPIFGRPNILTEILGIGCSSPAIMENVIKAGNDSGVERILLDLDTPGGSVVGTNETANVIKKVASNKPVDGYIRGECCSAGYWLASPSRKLYLDATAGVGSIGVVAIVPKKKDDDYEMEIVNSASPYKRPDPESEEGYNVIRSMVDDIAAVFMESVAVNRGVSVETVKSDFGKGGILIGQKAVDAGMVDGVSSFSDVLQIQEYGKGGSSMDLKTLKADHKDLYDQIVAEALSGSTSEIDALKAKVKEQEAALAAANGTIDEKDKEIEGLKDHNTKMDDRMKALEKNDAIRAQKDIETTASTIFSHKISQSSLAENLHSKVKGQVDHNKFVDEKGVFDSKAYSEAVDTEIKDWEDSISASAPATTFIGGTPPPRRISGEGNGDGLDAKSLVDRMKSHAGIKTE